MHFTKISSATAVFLISMISASPIQFSDVSFATHAHLHPTANFVSMDSATDKPYPTAFSASNPKFTALPSSGFKNAPHHSLSFSSSSSTNIETTTLPTATPTVTAADDNSEETNEIQTRATKGGNKTSGSGSSNAGGGGAKKRNASANSGGSTAKGGGKSAGSGSGTAGAGGGVDRYFEVVKLERGSSVGM
ncbi:hypothetical protein OCU04_009553 [Sclerotinia nivalis]|uniref:Uncharacterized protein n=1 Tax=Sclerotinia nivalis TaxID=352851 RepID=A0A9X0DGM9_9HELO|nr:hypothetical protein OCU04_009553 [Sclerotinia nivalis]